VLDKRVGEFKKLGLDKIVKVWYNSENYERKHHTTLIILGVGY